MIKKPKSEAEVEKMQKDVNSEKSSHEALSCTLTLILDYDFISLIMYPELKNRR